MTRWFVKDLAKLTHVSVQTLHHYDRMGLLKPSARMSNGYRVYTEKDLLKLQQIVALKYFGFELKQIKTLLNKNIGIKDQLKVQSRFLDEKVRTLQSASEVLTRVISECGDEGSLPWETMIKLIEAYQMIQELEKTWAGRVLSPVELKEYAGFEQGLKTRFSDADKEASGKEWASIVIDVSHNLKLSPASDIGFELAKRCMDFVNKLYGKQYAQLRRSIWEKGFQKGKMDDEHAISQEVVDWLDRALDHYCLTRRNHILAKTDSQTLGLWNDFMDEMFGNDEGGKTEFVKTTLSDPNLSTVAKAWLNKHFAS